MSLKHTFLSLYKHLVFTCSIEYANCLSFYENFNCSTRLHVQLDMWSLVFSLLGHV